MDRTHAHFPHPTHRPRATSTRCGRRDSARPEQVTKRAGFRNSRVWPCARRIGPRSRASSSRSETKPTQPFGAGTLHESEIVRVVHHNTSVRILVVNATGIENAGGAVHAAGHSRRCRAGCGPLAPAGRGSPGLPGVAREAARRTHEVALLNQERLNQVLDGVALSPMAAVGGCRARPGRWRIFRRSWQAICDRGYRNRSDPLRAWRAPPLAMAALTVPPPRTFGEVAPAALQPIDDARRWRASGGRWHRCLPASMRTPTLPVERATICQLFGRIGTAAATRC